MLTPQEITCSLFCRGGGCVDVGLGRLRRPPSLTIHPVNFLKFIIAPLHFFMQIKLDSPLLFQKIHCGT